MSEKIQKNDVKAIITITLKLLIISSVTALMLAVINALTAPTIAENTAFEKQSAIATVFPNAEEIISSEILSGGVNEIYLVKANNDVIGYAASVVPNGFGGNMDIMVGVDRNGNVVGIKIVSHSETPGLGSRVDSNTFLSQYSGLSGELTVGKDVDAITGSTISSKAVTSGVNSALSAYGKVFGGQE